MADEANDRDGAERILRDVARTLSIFWSGCWIIFGLLSGVGEGLGPGTVLAHTALPGFIFLAATLIAWRWEALGGILLSLLGVGAAVFFVTQFESISAIGMLFVLIYATFPALLASSLYLIDWRKTRTDAFSQRSA